MSHTIQATCTPRSSDLNRPDSRVGWTMLFLGAVVLTLSNCSTERITERRPLSGKKSVSPLHQDNIQIAVTVDAGSGFALTTPPVLNKVEAICASNLKYSANLAASEVLTIPKTQSDCFVFPTEVAWRNAILVRTSPVTLQSQINGFHNLGTYPGSYYMYPTSTASQVVSQTQAFALSQLPAGSLAAAPTSLSVNFKFVLGGIDNVGPNSLGFPRASSLSIQSSGEGFPEFAATSASLVVSTFAGDSTPPADICPLEARFSCTTPVYTNAVMTGCDGAAFADMSIFEGQLLPSTSVSLTTVKSGLVLSDPNFVKVIGTQVIVRFLAPCHRTSGTMASETMTNSFLISIKGSLPANVSIGGNRLYSWTTTLNY